MSRAIPSKILVIRFSSIGDIVLTEPALARLREMYPGARIDFLTKSGFGDLVRWNPSVDGVIDVNLRNLTDLRALRRRIKTESYELIVDLHGSLRSRFLRMFRPGVRVRKVRKFIFRRFLLVKFGWNTYAGVVPVAERYLRAIGDREHDARHGARDGSAGGDPGTVVRCHIPEEVAETAREILSSSNSRGTAVGFAPAARHFTKRWPMERFVALGIGLAREGRAILIFGGPGDEEYCDDIAQLINSATGSARAHSFAGKLSIMETAAGIEQCALLVTNDTGLMHLAAARGKRVVALMGPGVPELGFFPNGAGHTVFENVGLRCRPCSHIGRDRCPKGHFQCMTAIEPDTVRRRVSELLNA